MSAADRFAALFSGYTQAHGQYIVESRDGRGKLTGRAKTVKGAPDWNRHLLGERGVGSIPLRDDNTVVFAAIDIDKYDLKIEEVSREAERQKMSLLACQSKSGGVHLYVFFSVPQPAQRVRDILNDWAGWLGYGGSEIFPKQSYRSGPEDIGNWINLPYFGDHRKCYHKGAFLSLEEFLDVAEAYAAQSNDLDDIGPKHDEQPVSELMTGAPPCLLHFYRTGGVPEGHRHNSLFSVITFCKKKWPDEWQEKVAQVCVAIGLHRDGRTVAEEIKSIGKKNYDYECKGPWCNTKQCRKTQFGKGESSSIGTTCDIQSITRIISDPVVWILDVEGVRVKASTDQLYNQHAFNKLCMEALSRCPTTMPPAKWMKYLDDRLKTADSVQAPEESSPFGIFRELFYWYLTRENRRAMEKDEILLGKTYLDTDTGVIMFRASGLYDYLSERRFQYPSRMDVWLWARKLGAVDKVVRIDRKNTRVWAIAPPQPDEPTE